MKRTKEPGSLGEKLKNRREALSLTIEQIAHEIQSPPKFIEALEADDYNVFPAKVYALGFLKKLLHVIQVTDPDEVLREFESEWVVRTYHKNTLPTIKGVDAKKTQITPKRLGFLLASIALLSIVLFFGLRFKSFVSSPEIYLESTQKEQILYKPFTKISGKTQKESLLTMNGREIKIDAEGNFDEMVELLPGLNILEFLVKNRFGKESKETRYVLVK